MRRTAVALVLTAGLLGLTGCGGSDPAASEGPAESSKPAAASASPESNQAKPTVSVVVKSGKVTKGSGQHPVKLGSEVVLEITSDVADEIHIHGYDVEAALKPGEPTRVTFTADAPGVFEVETHESGLLLCKLRVQ